MSLSLSDPPLSSRGNTTSRLRKVWLHLASSSESPGAVSANPRKRPEPLRGDFELYGDTPNSVDTSCSTKFPFISPVEPVLTLARFHRSMNKVYIPLDEDEELEVGEEGFQSLNHGKSNFALLGTPGSSLLATGAYGRVYKAIHFPTMRRVAIKKILKDFDKTNEFANSFARELRNLYRNVREINEEAKSARSSLIYNEQGPNGHCPFLLTLYDAYIERDPTNLCLVLEYMEGGSLEQMIKQNADGCEDEGLLREICHNILRGLLHLHQRNYLHQDVKPGNIMLTASKFAKLGDFGLTVSVTSGEEASENDEVEAVGTIRYWPPELWGPETHRDPEGRGDIWGLGMTALAVATGQEPLDSCTTRSQVEIELTEAWKEATTRGCDVRTAAEERGIFHTRLLKTRGFSVSFQDFIHKCLADLPVRPTAAELLEHSFIKEYYRGAGSRQRELEEAVKALKTHIEIHKEWKITPEMIDLLAKELRIKSADLKEYLAEHLDRGLMSISKSSPGQSAKGKGSKEPEEALASLRSPYPLKADEEDLEDESVHMTLLNHYDELDRLRSIVIPPLEDLVVELRKQLQQKDEELAEAQKEIESLRKQLTIFRAEA